MAVIIALGFEVLFTGFVGIFVFISGGDDYGRVGSSGRYIHITMVFLYN